MRRIRRCLLLLAWLLDLGIVVQSFVVLPQSQRRIPPLQRTKRLPAATNDNLVEEYRQEAERIRLQAEKLEWELNLEKMQKLQEKISKVKRKDSPEEMEHLQNQLEILQDKLRKANEKGATSVSSNTPAETTTTKEQQSPPSSSNAAVVDAPTVTRNTSIHLESSNTPFACFDADDLALYMPIVQQIEQHYPNATLEQQLDYFREAPELQSHFKDKLTELLLNPLQNLQQLEELKAQYLYSSSSVEKDNLKRQIDTLSKQTNNQIVYTDSIFLNVPPLTDSQIQERRVIVQQLPPVLQFVYKRRYNLTPNDDDVELAILLDHYEQQLQLLDQASDFLEPSETDQVQQTVDSLPPRVQRHLAHSLGLDASNFTRDDLVAALTTSSSDTYSTQLSELAGSFTAVGDGGSLEHDLEFVDRSRYIHEFFPSVARLESQHPTIETVQAFAKCFSRNTFMVDRKPERVCGGWYVRGVNKLDDDEEGVRLLASLESKFRMSGLQNKLDYFFLNDPSPPTDEQVELEAQDLPVFLVTAKNHTALYDSAGFFTKTGISTLACIFTIIFGAGVCTLDPSLQERMDATMTAIGLGQSVSIEWLVEVVFQIVGSLFAIQFAHELAHRVFAWKGKFDIGYPTLLPSLSLGTMGAITPLRSPPPSMKSLFDFAIAGPALGFLVSMGFFVSGLEITSSLDFGTTAFLPALPTNLLRSSALGGGMIEMFLGKGVITQNPNPDATLSLHPFAIAGFCGILTNSLSLLPLGNTDGGRIAVSMFGRRGAYIVKSFTASLLCLAGIFGFDESGVLLTYTLFAIIWQRELESPVHNEVEVLDFGRGAFGIAAAVLVALALLPMQ